MTQKISKDLEDLKLYISVIEKKITLSISTLEALKNKAEKIYDTKGYKVLTSFLKTTTHPFLDFIFQVDLRISKIINEIPNFSKGLILSNNQKSKIRFRLYELAIRKCESLLILMSNFLETERFLYVISYYNSINRLEERKTAIASLSIGLRNLKNNNYSRYSMYNIINGLSFYLNTTEEIIAYTSPFKNN